jgi:hypothetical protein
MNPEQSVEKPENDTIHEKDEEFITPFYKQWWFWVIAGVFFLLVIIEIFLMIFYPKYGIIAYLLFGRNNMTVATVDLGQLLNN